MNLLKMFGNGMTMKPYRSFLAQIDSGHPFLAGKIDRGSVYLMGPDIAVQGSFRRSMVTRLLSITVSAMLAFVGDQTNPLDN